MSQVSQWSACVAHTMHREHTSHAHTHARACIYRHDLETPQRQTATTTKMYWTWAIFSSIFMIVAMLTDIQYRGTKWIHSLTRTHKANGKCKGTCARTFSSKYTHFRCRWLVARRPFCCCDCTYFPPHNGRITRSITSAAYHWRCQRRARRKWNQTKNQRGGKCQYTLILRYRHRK